MRSSNPIRKLRLWLLFQSKSYILPLAAILLAVNVGYDFFFTNSRINPETQHIRYSIEELDTETRALAEEWIETDDEDLFLERLWKKETLSKWQEEGISLVFYEKDSIVYWTTYPSTIYEHTDEQFRSSGTLEQIGSVEGITRVYRDNDKTAVVIFKLRDENEGKYNPYIFNDQRIELLPAKDSIRASLTGAKRIEAADNTFYVEAKKRVDKPWMIELCGWLAILLITILIKNAFQRRTTRSNAYQRALILIPVLVLWRALIHYTGIPNEHGELFKRIFGQHFLLLHSFGDLLISFSIVFIYTSYLYQIRFKLRWQYSRLSKPYQVLYGAAFSVLAAVMISAFHYVLILVIYTPRINIQIYDFSGLSFKSAIFYLLAVIFFSIRFLMTKLNQINFSTRSFILRTATTIILILIFLHPFESEIQDSGYILTLFYLIYCLLDFVRDKYNRRGAYLISLIVVSAYITFFGMQENSRAQNNAQKIYAKILATSAQDRALLQNEEFQSASPGSLDVRFRDFTYARITDDQTTFNYNNYNNYKELLPKVQNGRDTTISMDGQSHFVYYYYGPQLQNGMLIVSRRETTFLDAASLYAYIFLMLSIIGGVFLELAGYTFNFQKLGGRMIIRIRIVVIGLVIFTMVTVAAVIISHTIDNFYDDRRQFMNNNIQRLSVSLEQYLSYMPAEIESYSEWLASEKNEWAFSIHIYDLNGNTVISSLDNPKAGRRMESEAFKFMHYDGFPYFVNDTDEKNYISAYTPILKDGKRIGYLNMRYYNALNKSSVFRQKLMTDMLNLFLIILFVAVIMSEILYRFLIKPFMQLHDAMRNISQMQKIDAEKSSRKISDEMGQLVQQYNLMIDYLEDSYRQLAQSEREGAWREMARQVAHEIKNPLTPMRLRIQMLQRAMKEESCENMRPKVEGTLTLLLEQIELLSNIASEFSDFAKLGEGNPKKIDLIPLMNHVIMLYSGYDVRIRFEQEEEASSGIWVTADSEHLTRVFVNLFQNAVQALAHQEEARIDVRMEIAEGRVSISVRDNGPGIPEDFREKIFQPNFTTKSSGSGLGLAISGKIVELIGGTVRFETSTEPEDHGTVFIVNLPLWKEAEKSGPEKI